MPDDFIFDDTKRKWESPEWIQALAFETTAESDTHEQVSMALRINLAVRLVSIELSLWPKVVTIMEPDDDFEESVWIVKLKIGWQMIGSIVFVRLLMFLWTETIEETS